MDERRMLGVARYERHAPPPPLQQPQTLKQIAASVFDHLRKSTLRPRPGSRSAAKIVAGNATFGRENSRNFKSIRSAKSTRTGGRADDEGQWEYSSPARDTLKQHPTDSHPRTLSRDGESETQFERKRQQSLRKNVGANEGASGQGSKRDVRVEDLYGGYNNLGGNAEDLNDDYESDEDDDEGDDEAQLEQALTAEAQDELAYFSQRVGSIDHFKLQRRHVIHPHGRTRAFWDSVLLFLITCASMSN